MFTSFETLCSFLQSIKKYKRMLMPYLVAVSSDIPCLPTSLYVSHATHQLHCWLNANGRNGIVML